MATHFEINLYNLTECAYKKIQKIIYINKVKK